MQLTFEGKTIDQLAIELIQAYYPGHPYYLGNSSGKDSAVTEHLTMRAETPYESHYSVSPLDPPEVRLHLKEYYPNTIWDYNAKGFFTKHLMTHGLPVRKVRWCCSIIKESGGSEYPIKILGMRKAESNGRKQYKCFENHAKERGNWLLPILNWSDADVWQYISEYKLKINPLYKQGWKRIGCLFCPFAGRDEIKMSLAKYPRLANAWKEAATRYVNERNTNPKRKPIPFETGEEYFNWWIKR